MKSNSAPRDSSGAPLRKADRVRIIGIPDLTGMGKKARAESKRVFERLVGTYRRISDFDKIGLVGIWFRLRKKGSRCGPQWIAIEPILLRKVRAKRQKTP